MSAERVSTRGASAAEGPHGGRGRPRSVANVRFPGEGDADPDQPFEEGAQDEIDPDLRHRLISEAAYMMYAKRGYAEGYELDDWLAAESEVDHLLLNPQYARGPEVDTPES